MADGATGNNPFNNPKLTADYVATWVQGANSTYGLHIDYGTAAKVSRSLPDCLFGRHPRHPVFRACPSRSHECEAGGGGGDQG